jgi:hypothetical protein
VFCQAQQTIDQRRQIPQACFQMALDAMIQLFGVKQFSHPTQVRFDREALIPRAALTQFDVARWGILFAQAQVCQRNRLTIISGYFLAISLGTSAPNTIRSPRLLLINSP